MVCNAHYTPPCVQSRSVMHITHIGVSSLGCIYITHPTHPKFNRDGCVFYMHTQICAKIYMHVNYTVAV